MNAFSFELVRQYPKLDQGRRAVVRDWIANSKYLELAILLNDPDVSPGLDQALSDYRKSRVKLSPELAAYIILAVVLVAAIYISTYS